MNSIPGREPRPDRSRYQSTKGIPNQNPEGPRHRGYYLALTFGTLLSSQGADAQKLDPFGFRHWRLSHYTPLAGMNTCVGSPRPQGASAAQRIRRYTTPEKGCTGGLGRGPRDASGHARRPELDA